MSTKVIFRCWKLRRISLQHQKKGGSTSTQIKSNIIQVRRLALKHSHRQEGGGGGAFFLLLFPPDKKGSNASCDNNNTVVCLLSSSLLRHPTTRRLFSSAAKVNNVGGGKGEKTAILCAVIFLSRAEWREEEGYSTKEKKNTQGRKTVAKDGALMSAFLWYPDDKDWTVNDFSAFHKNIFHFLLSYALKDLHLGLGTR